MPTASLPQRKAFPYIASNSRGGSYLNQVGFLEQRSPPTPRPSSSARGRGAAPDRLIGLPLLPETPEGALTELEQRTVTSVRRQVNLVIANVKPKLNDSAWDPLW